MLAKNQIIEGNFMDRQSFLETFFYIIVLTIALCFLIFPHEMRLGGIKAVINRVWQGVTTIEK